MLRSAATGLQAHGNLYLARQGRSGISGSDRPIPHQRPRIGAAFRLRTLLHNIRRMPIKVSETGEKHSTRVHIMMSLSELQPICR